MEQKNAVVDLTPYESDIALLKGNVKNKTPIDPIVLNKSYEALSQLWLAICTYKSTGPQDIFFPRRHADFDKRTNITRTRTQVEVLRLLAEALTQRECEEISKISAAEARIRKEFICNQQNRDQRPWLYYIFQNERRTTVTLRGRSFSVPLGILQPITFFKAYNPWGATFLQRVWAACDARMSNVERPLKETRACDISVRSISSGVSSVFAAASSSVAGLWRRAEKPQPNSNYGQDAEALVRGDSSVDENIEHGKTL